MPNPCSEDRPCEFDGVRVGDGGAVWVPMCGMLSKWVCAGVEMLDSEEISEEMTSGDVGGKGGLFMFSDRGALDDRPDSDLWRHELRERER